MGGNTDPCRIEAPERSVFAVNRSPDSCAARPGWPEDVGAASKTAASKLAKSIRLHGHPLTRFVLDGR